MRGATPWVLGGLLVGCSSGDVFLRAEWPRDHVAIAVVTDASGAPLAEPMMKSLGMPIELTFEPEDLYRVFVRTYEMTERAPNGMPIGDCPVSVGGNGPLLPVPATAWRTDIIDPRQEGVVELGPATGELVDLDLRYAGCAPIDRGCEGFSSRRLEVPSELIPQQVAAVSDELAMIGGNVHAGPARQMMLARIQGGEVTVLPPHPGRIDWVGSLAWDGNGAFFAVNGEQRLVAFDLDGDPITLAEDLTLTGVAAGRDGTVVAFDATRTIDVLAQGAIFVRRTDAPVGIEALAVARANRIAARIDDSAYVYDGRTWELEYDAALFSSIDSVFADEDLIGAVGNREHVVVRDDVDGVWHELPIPFDEGVDFKGVTGLGRGRFVAVGRTGAIAAWTGTQWCDLSVEEPGTFRSVSASPSGQVAWTVSSSDGETPPAIVEIRAPSPDVP